MMMFDSERQPKEFSCVRWRVSKRLFTKVARAKNAVYAADAEDAVNRMAN